MRIAVFAILSLFVGALGSYIIFKQPKKAFTEESAAAYNGAERKQSRASMFFDYPLHLQDKTVDRSQEKKIIPEEEILHQKDGYLHKIQNHDAPVEKIEPQYYRHGRSQAVWSETADFQ